MVNKEQKATAVIDVANPPDSNIRKEGAQEKKEVSTAEGTTGADVEGKVPAVIEC